MPKNYFYESGYYNLNELYHYGIKGMKWGVRRYQNPDGTLTPAGRKRLYQDIRESAAAKKHMGYDQAVVNFMSKHSKELEKSVRDIEDFWYKSLTENETNTYDFSKGSPEYVSNKKARANADRLLKNMVS